MGRARITEVDYHLFRSNLRRASDVGGVIEKTDKSKWGDYVRRHDVKEASCLLSARSRGEDAKPVIISYGDASDGYYVYSTESEFCLLFEREPDVGNAGAGQDETAGSSNDSAAES